jgi:hypothetical protein
MGCVFWGGDAGDGRFGCRTAGVPSSSTDAAERVSHVNDAKENHPEASTAKAREHDGAKQRKEKARAS